MATQRRHRKGAAAALQIAATEPGVDTESGGPVAALPASEQAVVRTLFQRLVTPERTRSVVEMSELEGLAPQAGQARSIVDRLVAARLLVVQTGGAEGPTLELVHESLINGWPTLRSWLDEGQEDAAYLAQLRAAARQWDQKKRQKGLLWSGEAAEEALQEISFSSDPLNIEILGEPKS